MSLLLCFLLKVQIFLICASTPCLLSLNEFDILMVMKDRDPNSLVLTAWTPHLDLRKFPFEAITSSL